MISHDAQVLGHRMPLRRIETQPIWPADEKPNYFEQMAAEALEHGRQCEAKRIWEITRQVAQGCNQPTVTE